MSFFKDKVILVTGAGGSIGSELCQQLIEHKPKMLILFDSSELALYNIDRKLSGLGHNNVISVLGDVSWVEDVQRVFLAQDVDVVFHTAAYKHVTLCQGNPNAAHRVNVYGTEKLVRIAAESGVPRLILISTDKAVRPTCIMGSTKRQAEAIVRDYNYTTVRLGNVYGSSGSVVPLWKEQIAAGEPVTITHPNATRYFTDVSYAASKIIMAAHPRAETGVLVLEMGAPRNLVDVARELGAKQFKYTGLRPGEKLHEELFVGQRRQSAIGGLSVDDTSQQAYRDAA